MKRFTRRIFNRARNLRSIKQPKQLESDADIELDESDPRYDACMVLADHNIPSCIFGEDALAHHGVPTGVFDLYLVVADTKLAASKLMEAGYSKRPQPSAPIRIPEFSERYVFGPEASQNSSAYPDDTEKTAVVLLDAAEWHYKMPDSVETMADWFPSLEEFLDSIMSRWTDETSQGLRGHLAVHISYCYLYIKDVNMPGFATKLSKENRQLHHDQFVDTDAAVLDTDVCQEHYRMVRTRIRSGEHEPTGGSFGVRRFPQEGQS